MYSNLKLCVAAAVVCVASSTPIKADSIPLFVYQFPNSCSDLSPEGAVVNDLGAGNHDATPQYFATAGLSTDVPTALSGKSVEFTSTAYPALVTHDKRLLNTADVATNGGFVMDVWFKPTADSLNASRHKLIDYDGTELLELHNGSLLFRTSETAYQIYSSPLTADTWYHATAVFDTLGNPAVDDPSAPGYQKVAGEMSLYLDGTLVNTIAGVKGGVGDSENAPIGIGRYATSNTYGNYYGLMYNPQLWLGTQVGTVPEPSAAILTTIGAGGLLCYAWRKRR